MPGASKTPFATPDAFGAQIGVAQEKAGRAIESGLDKLGGALTEQWNEQEAVKGKTILSDHEAAVTEYKAKLDRDTPPDQASTKPQLLQDFITNDWNQRRGGVAGKYQMQADGSAHDYHNRLKAAADVQAVSDKDKYVELQIDSAAEKQAAALQANPGQMPSATSAIKAQVDETGVNWFEKRRMLLKYGQQMYAGALQGYADRMEKEPFNDALAKEAEDFRKNGAAQVSKQLGVQDLPPTTPGPPAGAVNQKRVSQIDNTPVGPIIDKVAAQTGQDPAAMKVKASIESGGRANAVTGQYKGVFQLSDKEFQKWVPGGDIFNPEQNAYAAAQLFLAKSSNFAKNNNGRLPTLTEDYMMHQQGEGGAAAHYANPDAPAWRNMLSTSEGRQKGEAWSKKAIWGNIPDTDKAKFGSVENVTSRDLINIYDKKLTGGSGGDVTAFKGPVRQDHLAEADKAMGFNTQERELYRTHLKNLYGPGGVDNAPSNEFPQGSRSTLFVTTAEFDGKTYLIPTVKDGKIMSKDDAVAAAKKDGIEKYPAYANADDAMKRYNEMHGFMAKDTGDYFEAKNGRLRMTQQPTAQPLPPGTPQTRPVIIKQNNGFAVVPTTVPDGSGGFKVVSDSQAVATSQSTGQHAGVFDSSSAANDYANRLRGQDIRANTPRDASLSDAAPMLGQTPKEMQAVQDHWKTKFQAIDVERKRIQDLAKTRATNDYTQEEAATKTHGEQGINPMWTPQSLGMVLGAHDAQVYLDKRQANLNFNAYTKGWTPQSDPAQMQHDLDQLDPARIDPQSAAFAHYQKNYDDAHTLMNKMISDREKVTKYRGDIEMKKITDMARTGVVTQDAIDAAKPWLSHTELTAAYNLKDNPPVVHNDALTIEAHNNVTKLPPAEFQQYMMGAKAKNAFSNDEFKTLLDRNDTYWKQGVNTPIVDAHKWLESKMTPGMAGIEGSIMRGALADADRELKDWENNPLNQPMLKDRALVMKQADDIWARYRNEGMKQIRFGLPPSMYFPPGVNADNVDATAIATATQNLQADMRKTDSAGHRLLSDAEIATRWNNIKAWKDTLPPEEKQKSNVPPPAPTVAPQKMSATIAPPPQGIPPPDARPQADYNELAPNQNNGAGYDANAITPDTMMKNYYEQGARQENI
jgi:hypothetical protein